MADTFVDYLKSIYQDHIAEKYLVATQEQKNRLKDQIQGLNNTYPGGLKAYVQTARKLLQESKDQVNPYQGMIPSVPQGVDLNYNTPEVVLKYEEIGEKQMQRTGFVLVAGGLGERLGYKGIKVAIPMDIATQTTFLGYYIQYILSIQKKLGNGKKLPFAIMTSDDTHALTVKLLQSNDYFGMDTDQITLMKQQKVPALLDINGRIALEGDDLVIQTKPHGHGDIHTLMYSNKLTQIWQQKYDTKWVVFFQDTNPLMFRSLIATIGVSKQKNFQMNTVGIKIKQGQAVGAITKLTDKNGKQLVINVEYNQLSQMLKQFKGPVADEDGHLLLPGNTNGLVFDLERYHKVLEKTKGSIVQFINPKYTDNTKTSFKSPARLQCMMQDIPKLFESSSEVGFTMIDRKYCYSACKNDIVTAKGKFKSGLSMDSSSSCQQSIYDLNRTLLRICGAQIQQGQPVQINQIKTNLFPMIYISPNFSITLKQLKTKVKKLKVSGKSTLVILSDSIDEDLEVDGTTIFQKDGSKHVSKEYQTVVPSIQNDKQWILIRGYKKGESSKL